MAPLQLSLPIPQITKQREGIYKGRVLIKYNDIYNSFFGAFFTSKQYDSLDTIKEAIDSGSIDSGVYPKSGTIMTLKSMI